MYISFISFTYFVCCTKRIIFRLQAVGFLKVSRCHHSNMSLVNSKSGSVRENDVEVIEYKT